ncbi:MAG: pentapeptide repeat-containing protein [Anaerolineae bacterium]|nr:pentapeptide repeat-containing protein [Anaerolineae bacterium]
MPQRSRRTIHFFLWRRNGSKSRREKLANFARVYARLLESEVNFIKANLEGADLCNAILYDANLKNVTMPDGSIHEQEEKRAKRTWLLACSRYKIALSASDFLPLQKVTEIHPLAVIMQL